MDGTLSSNQLAGTTDMPVQNDFFPDKGLKTDFTFDIP